MGSIEMHSRRLEVRYPTMYRRVDFDDSPDESALQLVEFIPAPEDDEPENGALVTGVEIG